MKNVSEIMFRWCLTYDAVYNILDLNDNLDIKVVELGIGLGL